MTPTLSRFVPIPVPYLVQHLIKLGSYQILKNLNSVTINGIDEELKVADCRPVSWIFKDDKNDNIEIIIEQVLHITGLPIWTIFP